MSVQLSPPAHKLSSFICIFEVHFRKKSGAIKYILFNFRIATPKIFIFK